MVTKIFGIHYKIINIWFGFALFLIVISNLQHQNVPIFSWINWSVYFFLFLQSFYLYRRAENNKFCFLNISGFALFSSLTFIRIFTGEQGFFGSTYLAWYLYEYFIIAINFSFTLCVIYICIKYLFRNFHPFRIYTISLSIILPILIGQFYPVFLDKYYILDHETLFDKSLLYFNFLPLFFLIFYGILLYKYDRSLGEHINTIMVCFFIMTITDTANLLGYVYHIMNFQLTQFVLLISLSFFLITMFKLLNHSYSAFGQFYDSIMAEGKNFGVPIKRKKSNGVLILGFVRVYFHQRRNAITFGTLFFMVSCYINMTDLWVNISTLSWCAFLL